MAIQSSMIDAGPTVQRIAVREVLLPVVNNFDMTTGSGKINLYSNLDFPNNWEVAFFLPTEGGRLLAETSRLENGTFDANLYCSVDMGGGNIVWKRIFLYSYAINTSTGRIFDPLSQLPGAGGG